MSFVVLFFFFNDTATTEIYTLSPTRRSSDLTFLFGVIILIANILKRAFSSQLAAKLRNRDRKSGSAGMPRPISYAVFCLKKKKRTDPRSAGGRAGRGGGSGTHEAGRAGTP